MEDDEFGTVESQSDQSAEAPIIEKTSNWGHWSHGDRVAINHNVDPAGGQLLANTGESNTSMSADHLHFYNNPEADSEHHKPDFEVGARIVEDKQTTYISENLFEGVKYFLGF